MSLDKNLLQLTIYLLLQNYCENIMKVALR